MVFFFQAEDGIRDYDVTGVQTCALPIWFKEITAFGIILVSKTGFAGGTNRDMAWTASEMLL